jgi:hypothetical protein
VLSWFRRKQEPDEPLVRRHQAGTLKVLSGTVLIGEPGITLDELQLESVPTGEHPVFALVIHYPEGGRRVASVELVFSTSATGAPEQLGEIGVDGGTVALIDNKVREQFWKNEGSARIGVLGTPQHRKIAKLLRKRFGLKSEPVNPIRSELVQPVSKELEEEIIAYLETNPEYADYSFMYFRIETRNTRDQLLDNLEAQGLWCELVLDRPSGANVLAFQSGFGDGCYPAYGVRSDGRLAKVAVEFIRPAQEKILEAFPLLRY